MIVFFIQGTGPLSLGSFVHNLRGVVKMCQTNNTTYRESALDFKSECKDMQKKPSQNTQ